MRRTRELGYSLVELAVTMAVVAILAAVAFPNFQNVLRSNRVSTASNELMASLSLARVEALRSPGGAGLCASSDGASCGDDWNAGWMVWIDLNGNGEVDTGSAADPVLKFIQGRDALDITASEGVDTLLFDRRGRVREGSGTTFSMAPKDACPEGADLVRELEVNAAGQVHVTKKSCES